MPAGPDTHARRWALTATAVAVVPVVVAGVRRAAGSWVPVGDQAYFTVRSRDVLTPHHPLVGAFSSASVELDRLVNNLGPLQFDLLAPFAKIAPWGGTALGVAAVHVAAIVTIAWLAARLAGPPAVAATMAVVVALTWALGSERLITPVQHPYLVVPMLAFLVAAWATAAGDRFAPVAMVATGSLCAQTHLSTAPIVIVVTLAACIIAWFSHRSSATSAGQPPRAVDRHVMNPSRRPLVVPAGVAIALWAQPFADQFWGTGNLADVLRAGGDSDGGGQPGLATAVRIVAGTLGDPRRLVRGGFTPQEGRVPLGGPAAVTALLVLVLAALAIVFVRRGPATGRRARAGAAVWLTAVFAAVLTAWRLPVTAFDLPATNYRWLWSLAAFGWVGVLAAAATAGRRAVPSAAWLVPVVGLAVCNLPTGPHDAAAMPATVRVVSEFVDELEHGELLDGVGGPLRFDDSHLYFGHPYNYPLMAALQSRGIDLHFAEEYHVRRFGERRRADGSEVATIVLYHADEARALAGQNDTLVVDDGDGRVVAAVLEWP